MAGKVCQQQWQQQRHQQNDKYEAEGEVCNNAGNKNNHTNARIPEYYCTTDTEDTLYP